MILISILRGAVYRNSGKFSWVKIFSWYMYTTKIITHEFFRTHRKILERRLIRTAGDHKKFFTVNFSHTDNFSHGNFPNYGSNASIQFMGGFKIVFASNNFDAAPKCKILGILCVSDTMAIRTIASSSTSFPWVYTCFAMKPR